MYIVLHYKFVVHKILLISMSHFYKFLFIAYFNVTESIAMVIYLT